LLDRNKITGETSINNIQLYVNGDKLVTTRDNIKVPLDKVIIISSEKSKSPEDIEKMLEQARAKIPDGKSVYPKTTELYNAMHSVLAWNTIYDPINDRVINPVSRNWAAPSGLSGFQKLRFTQGTKGFGRKIGESSFEILDK